MNTKKEVLSRMPKKVEAVELESQKVELARKPAAILKDLQKLDGQMKTQEDKMSKIFNTYRQAQKDFVNFMQDAEAIADSLDTNIADVMNAAQEIGITDFKSIDGLAEADDLYRRLKDISRSAQKLYPAIN